MQAEGAGSGGRAPPPPRRLTQGSRLAEPRAVSAQGRPARALLVLTKFDVAAIVGEHVQGQEVPLGSTHKGGRVAVACGRHPASSERAAGAAAPGFRERGAEARARFSTSSQEQPAGCALQRGQQNARRPAAEVRKQARRAGGQAGGQAGRRTVVDGPGRRDDPCVVPGRRGVHVE